MAAFHKNIPRIFRILCLRIFGSSDPMYPFLPHGAGFDSWCRSEDLCLYRFIQLHGNFNKSFNIPLWLLLRTNQIFTMYSTFFEYFFCYCQCFENISSLKAKIGYIFIQRLNGLVIPVCVWLSDGPKS